MKKLLFFCLNVEGSGSFTHKSLKNQELFTSKGITPAGEKKTALASHSETTIFILPLLGSLALLWILLR